MLSDPISDALTRVRNAYAAGLKQVVYPYSKMAQSISDVLVAHNYAVEYQIDDSDVAKKMIILELRYNERKPSVTKIVKISTPGRRVYKAAADIRAPLNGYGIAVISTSKGVLTNSEAKKQKVGGEVICHIW